MQLLAHRHSSDRKYDTMLRGQIAKMQRQPPVARSIKSVSVWLNHSRQQLAHWLSAEMSSMAGKGPVAESTLAASESIGAAAVGVPLDSSVTCVSADTSSLCALLLGAAASADCTVAALECRPAAVRELLL